MLSSFFGGCFSAGRGGHAPAGSPSLPGSAAAELAPDMQVQTAAGGLGPGALRSLPTQGPGCPGALPPGLAGEETPCQFLAVAGRPEPADATEGVGSAATLSVRAPSELSSEAPKLQSLDSPLAAGIHRHELHTDLMDHSPSFMTAIAIDGSKVYQSPLSIRYYGDVSRSSGSNPAVQGPALFMNLLQNLFRLEGELLLTEMLRTVLGPGRQGEDSSEEAGSGGWHRTMRVPACCLPDNGAREQSPACGPLNPKPAVQLPHGSAPNSPQMPFGSAQQSNGGHPRSAEAGDHAASEMFSTTLSSSFTETAAAVSIAARNAPKRMKSLLDMSMSSKFLGSEDNNTCRSASSNISRSASINFSLDCSGAQSFDDRVAGTGMPAKHKHQRIQSASCVQPGPGAVRRASSLYVHKECASANPDGWDEVGATSAGPIQNLSSIASATSAPADISSMPTDVALEGIYFNTTAQADVSPPGDEDVQDNSAAPEEGSSARPGSVAAGMLNSLDLLSTDFSDCQAQLEREDVERVALPHPWHGTVPADGQAGDGHSVGDERDSCSNSQDADSNEREQWQEVFVRTTKDAEGRQLLLIYQNDVTLRTQLETAMARLTELQLDTLCQIFPRHVIEFLSCGGGAPSPATLGHLARSHEDVSILFMDIVGFTSMSKQVAPDAVMTFLNSLFSVFDNLCASNNVYKVETAGDCYIASSGLLSQGAEGFAEVVQDHDPKHSIANIFSFAKDMLAASRAVLMPHDGSPVVIRIGIHTGPCVSGVVGSKLPKFGIFGDTMNTASRMESTCTPGRIQVSAFTHSLLMARGGSCEDEWEAMGEMEIKGKGPMQTFQWLEPETPVPRPDRKGSSHSQLDLGTLPQGPVQGFLHQSAQLLQILQRPEVQQARKLKMQPPPRILPIFSSHGQLEQVLEEESLKLMKLPTASSLRPFGQLRSKDGSLQAVSHLRLQRLSTPMSKLLQMYGSVDAAVGAPASPANSVCRQPRQRSNSLEVSRFASVQELPGVAAFHSHSPGVP